MYQFQGAQGQHQNQMASSPNTYNPYQPAIQSATSATFPDHQNNYQPHNGLGERRASEPASGSQPCFNCGIAGHWAQDCREPRRAVPAGQQQPFRRPFKRQRTDNATYQQGSAAGGNFPRQSGHTPQRNQTHPQPGQSWTYKAPPKPANHTNSWNQHQQGQTPNTHMSQQWKAQGSPPATPYGQQSQSQFAPPPTNQFGPQANVQPGQNSGNPYVSPSNQYGIQPSDQYGQPSPNVQQPPTWNNQQPPNQYGQQPSHQFSQNPPDQYGQQAPNQFAQSPAQYSPPASQYPQSAPAQYPQASQNQYFQQPNASSPPTNAQYQQTYPQYQQQGLEYQQGPQFQQATNFPQQQPPQPSAQTAQYQQQPPFQPPAAQYSQPPSTQYPTHVGTQPSLPPQQHNYQAVSGSPAMSEPHLNQRAPHPTSPHSNGPQLPFKQPPLQNSSNHGLPGTGANAIAPVRTNPFDGNTQAEPESEQWWEDLKSLDYPEDSEVNIRHPANHVAQALPSTMKDNDEFKRLPTATSLPSEVPVSTYFRTSSGIQSPLQDDGDPATGGFTDSGELVAKEELASNQHNLASRYRETSETPSVEGSLNEATASPPRAEKSSAPAADGIPTPSNSHESEEERLNREQEERLAALGVTGPPKPRRRSSRPKDISTSSASIATVSPYPNPNLAHISPSTE